MNRTIVYPGTVTEVAGGGKASLPDDLASKLLKYIPGEVIAFYVPIYALVPKDVRWGLWLVFVLSISGTIGYLWVRSDPKVPPRPYFYLLAAVSFVGWALGTTDIGVDLWKLPGWVGQAAIPAGVLLIPLIDEILTRLTPAS